MSTVLFFLCIKSAMEADESDQTQPSNATVLTTVSMEQEREEGQEGAAMTLVASGSEDMVGKEGQGVEEGREGEEGGCGEGEMDPGKEGVKTEAAVVQESIGEASITFKQVTIMIINDLYLRE